MLTLNDILKVSRLLDQTGEPRPGFLHDEADNLEGQGTEIQPGALPSPSPSNSGHVEDIVVSVVLDYESDPKTGDIRIVQR
jgi:hypothetical protein